MIDILIAQEVVGRSGIPIRNLLELINGALRDWPTAHRMEVWREDDVLDPDDAYYVIALFRPETEREERAREKTQTWLTVEHERREYERLKAKFGG